MSSTDKILLTGRVIRFDADPFEAPPADAIRVDEAVLLTGGLIAEIGEAGVLRVDGEGRIWLRDFGSNAEREHQFAWEALNFGGDCVYLSCKQYLEAFRTGTPHPTDAREYLRNIRIENAIYQSDETRQRVAL